MTHPPLTPLEVEFLRLLPVDSLTQGMPGASWAALTKDLGQPDDEPERFVPAVIRGLRRKGIKVVWYEDNWAFLSKEDAVRLRSILEVDK